MGIKELKPNTVFNKIGGWYTTVKEIITSTPDTALCKCEEDDHYVKYCIFEKYLGFWQCTVSCADLEGAEQEYKLTVNYKNTKTK